MNNFILDIAFIASQSQSVALHKKTERSGNWVTLDITVFRFLVKFKKSFI